VRSDAPWKTMTELLDHAKANPGKLRVAIPGVGSIQHLLFESTTVRLLRQTIAVTAEPIGG
jgi:tripartite-type tricarboxylate transporter receptor subunit TctC